MSIKKIIHISDIHIRLQRNHNEYREVLTNLINDVKSVVENNKDEYTILLCGDTLDSFCSTSNELLTIASWLFSELDKICTVLVVCGNHELTRSNLQKLDSLTPYFNLMSLTQTTYLDMVTEYKSGAIELDDDNILILYSIFDNYKAVNIEKVKEEHSNKRIIGIIHAPIISSKTDIGFTIDKGIKMDMFDLCDIVLMGDIHKRQMLYSTNNIPMYYSGSAIQCNVGENTTGHGFSVIDLDTFEITHHEVENPYKIYKFEISSIDDIENNLEIWKNKGIDIIDI